MRRISAAVAVAALTTVMGAAASTAQSAPPAPEPGAQGGVRSTDLPGLQPRHTGARVAKAAPGARSSAATAADVTEMTSVCPAGQMFGKQYGNESFEAGLPHPEESVGWDTATGGPAADGASWAKSVVTTAEQEPDHYLAGLDAPIPTSGKVYAYFAYRSNASGDNAVVWANDSGVSLLPSVDWAYVLLDVSSEVGSYPGHMYIDAEQLGNGIVSDETFEVDDLGVYTCVPIPNAGVRGDWTGEGTVDVLATRTNDGSLWLYPGKGTGAVGSGRQVGSGWGGFTWLASPGDVTGDKRTDLIARNAAGALFLYAGRGDGGFASGRQIGSGWNVMTSLVTPGDMNLDGRPELLARRSDGTLHLYTFATGGTLSRVKQVGAGWNTTRFIIGRGDLNGDRRGDILAVRTDGTLYAYLTSSSLTFGKARLVGSGWNAMDLVTSPGDMNKDGYGDFIGRRADGALFFYPGRTLGTFGRSTQVGTGWQIFSTIL